MAHFLAGYISPTTNLPRGSYDLWEEKFITSTYTTAVVQAALREAAQLAERRHDANNAVHWTAIADDMRLAAVKYLVDKRGILYKGIREQIDGSYTIDDTLDSSSFYGAFMFGLFSPETIDLNETYKALSNEFSEQVGWSRYANDRYLHSANDGKTNPWIITSLWAAQYELLRGEIDKTNTTLGWVQSIAVSTGMLPEQLSDPPSVSPLVWSHAEFVTTLLDYVEDQRL
jgi:GH15 family glucan-1,4-alpha-glucosidase